MSIKLDAFVSNVNKKTKRNIITKGDEVVEMPRFDTGSLSLNVELGGGGPEGRIITMAGNDQDGKTVLALKMMAGLLQKHPSKKALWLDAEGVWDKKWAGQLGVDVNRVYVVHPDYAEQGYQIALEASKVDDAVAIVIDSVAAMTPKAEAEGDMEDVQVALAARLNKRFLRKVQREMINAQENGTREVIPTIILINQFTTNIGGYGNPDIEGGGKGLRYYPSVKIILKKGDMLDRNLKVYKYVGANDEGVETVAQQIKFYIEKNKTAPPKRRGHFWFFYDDLDSLRPKGSIDKLEEIIRYAKKYDIITQRGSMFDIPHWSSGEVLTFKGSAALAYFIREDQDEQNWIAEEVLRRVNDLHKDEPVSTDEEEKPEGHVNGKVEVSDEIGLDDLFRDDEEEGGKGSEGDRSKATA